MCACLHPLSRNSNQNIKNGFALTFDSWTPDRRVFETALDYQLDQGCFSDINCSKHSITAHRTEVRTGVPKKTSKLAVVDHLCFRKYFVEITGG